MDNTKQDVPLDGHVMQIMTLMASGLEEIKLPIACHRRQITTSAPGTPVPQNRQLFEQLAGIK